jgi:hypothetical protein
VTITDDPTTVVSDERAPLTPTPEAEAARAGAGRTSAELPPGEDATDEERPPSPRLAVAVAFPVVAASLMVGGVFRGVDPRIYAAVAGLLGVALAFAVTRLRRPVAANVLAVVGIALIGVVMVIPGNPSDAARVSALAREAAAEGDLLSPPVPFDQGWHAIVGWLMGIVGFAAGWVALAFRKPSLALLLPLPFAAFAGISVPDSQQVASGLAVLVFFAIGLGLLSSEQAAGDDEDERPPLAYEVRKALKALPLLAAIVVVLAVLSRAGFLFPPPAIDPAKEPQKPKTVPITEVEDRELFTVESAISGPWRMGALDVYDASDGSWRLPPFADNELEDVSSSGVVDRRFTQGVRATFTVRGLGGAVLPGLPNPVGVLASGLDTGLQYDARSGNIRLRDGQVSANQEYTVVAAKLPSVDDLTRAVNDFPDDYEQFTEIPDAPPAAQDLIDAAVVEHDDDWTRFDTLRTYVLDNVVAKGLGTPASVTMERAQEILTDLEGSPYEMVALQAMFARWLGIPARIGYGFDGGDVVEGEAQTLSIRPKHGASFPEVYFEGFGWLPVIGKPKQAEATVNSDPRQQQVDPSVLPSDEVAAQVYLPLVVDPPSTAAKQVAVTALVLALLAAVIAGAYAMYPGFKKARLRAKRRAAALDAGPRARVALAYAEWRDYATDLGYAHPTDTPLMYLDRFLPDEEHTELAWLVTRGLWGDLQGALTDEHAAAAVELSRSLRRRLAATQPGTLRAVAVISRLSLKNPFSPEHEQPAARRRPVLRRRRSRGSLGPKQEVGSAVS